WRSRAGLPHGGRGARHRSRAIRNRGPRHARRLGGARRGGSLATRSRGGGYSNGLHGVCQNKADVRAGFFREGIGEAHECEGEDSMKEQRKKDSATDRLVRNPPEPGSPVEGRIATRVLGPLP